MSARHRGRRPRRPFARLLAVVTVAAATVAVVPTTAPARVAPPTPDARQSIVLRPGQINQGVAELQVDLMALGYLSDTGQVTGGFGEQTVEAFQAFERMQAWTPTRWVRLGALQALRAQAQAASTMSSTTDPATPLIVPDLGGAVPQYPTASPVWTTCTPRLNGVPITVGATQRTLTVVDQTSTTYALLSFYVRTQSACGFTLMSRTAARLGFGGTVAGTERRQNTGTTPRGSYTMSFAFGNGPQPTTLMPYHETTNDDWWNEDPHSATYNTLVHGSAGGFDKSDSEHLRSFGSQYRLAVVINFNRPVTRPSLGAGIFLHVNGDGPTAGCISVPLTVMEQVMAWMTPGDKIVITS